MLGIGCLCWGLREPPSVQQFIERLERDVLINKPVFVFSSSYMNQGRVNARLSKYVQAKGCVVVGYLAVHAPECMARFQPKKDHIMLWGKDEWGQAHLFARVMQKRIDQIRQDGVPKKSIDVPGSIMGNMLAWCWSPKVVKKMLGGPLRINTESCIRCGMCVRNCPFGAISISGDVASGFPVIDPRKCMACCRCFNTCPKQAISNPRIVDKARYSFDPRVLIEGPSRVIPRSEYDRLRTEADQGGAPSGEGPGMDVDVQPDAVFATAVDPNGVFAMAALQAAPVPTRAEAADDDDGMDEAPLQAGTPNETAPPLVMAPDTHEEHAEIQAAESEAPEAQPEVLTEVLTEAEAEGAGVEAPTETPQESEEPVAAEPAEVPQELSEPVLEAPVPTAE
eukprot:gnl/Trimastix_PCT/4365.p1 GENE.gnl/Trimastix_PCT/4365~~gnl/Trimastix_PCT/4365.p1  ORF type:complete len:394 (+),score=97.98 gnl/Trimastix_PCT/4365:288-1469(+)